MAPHELSPSRLSLIRPFVTGRCRAQRSGAVYPLMVVALPVLLGVAALAIDLALMGLAAQRVQNVADTAAIAGAIKGTDAAKAVTASERTAVSNNDCASAWQVQTTATTYGPGETVPGFRTLGYREHVIAVDGATEFSFIFGRIFGLEQTTVSRSAAAMCQVWRNRLAEGFIFAGATDPGVVGVYSDGQANRFNGSIHSNTGVHLGGKDNIVTGDIRYRNDFGHGPAFTHNGDLIVTEVKQYPVDFAWSDFDHGPWDHDVTGINVTTGGTSLPGGRWRVRGNMTVNASDLHVQNALFVVDGDIYIGGARKVLDGVTLVAKGSITVIGADGYMSPYVHDLFAFSTKTSYSEDVMYIDGARCFASGVNFAPNGGLFWEGSAEHSYHVGLVGYTVKLIGSFSTHEGPASALVAEETTSGAKLVL